MEVDEQPPHQAKEKEKETAMGEIATDFAEVQIVEEEMETVGIKRVRREPEEATPSQRISREEFEKLKGQALIGFLNQQGLDLSDATVKILLENEARGKDLIGAEEETTNTLRAAGLLVFPARRIAKFVSTAFPAAGPPPLHPLAYLDLLFKDTLKAPQQAEPLAEFGFGKIFPYQGREQLKEAYQQGLYVHFHPDELNRETIVLPSICGAPGTGKTRAVTELPAIWKELVQEQEFLAPFKEHVFVHLHTTYNSFSPFSPFDEEVGPNASLAIRFYYCYFLKGRLPFEVFVSQITNIAAMKRLRLSELLDWIQGKIGHKCWFFLSVDDVQKTFKEEKVLRSLSFPGVLLSTLANVMHRDNRKEDYLSTSLVVGTLLGPIQDYMSRSSQKTGELKIPRLSEEHQAAIVDSALVKYKWAGKDKWGSDEKFTRLLKVYGNFARGLEAILSTYDLLLAKGELEFQQISPDAVAQRFQQLCRSAPVAMELSDARELLRVWLFQEAVGDGLIPGTKLDISQLEGSGYLMREAAVRHGQPKSMIHLLANGLQFLAETLAKDLPTFPIVKQSFLNLTPNPDEFERVIPHFLVLRASLAQPTPRYLKELFPGAKYHPEDLADLWIDPPLRVRQTTLRFKELRSQALQNPGEIQCTGDSNPGFDFFYLQINPEAGEQTAFCINAKKIIADATTPCRDAFTKTQGILDQERKPWKDGVVGVITTGKVTLGTALEPPHSRAAPSKALVFPKRVLVIDSEGLKTFLGPFHDYF